MIGQKSAADVTTQLVFARNYRICEIETSQTEAIYRCHQSANILPPQSETTDETVWNTFEFDNMDNKIDSNILLVNVSEKFFLILTCPRPLQT